MINRVQTFAINCNLRRYKLEADGGGERGRRPHVVGAVQVDPGYPVVFAVDPTLAFRDFQLLKPNHDELLSNVAVKCKLRLYKGERGARRAALRRQRHPAHAVARCGAAASPRTPA